MREPVARLPRFPGERNADHRRAESRGRERDDRHRRRRVHRHAGPPARQARPGRVLPRGVRRARAAGYEPMVGSELEFYLLRESYEEAHAKHYRDLTPSVPYILDYHILATTFDEQLIRQIRLAMQAAGIAVESSKGEAWPGQQ